MAATSRVDGIEQDGSPGGERYRAPMILITQILDILQKTAMNNYRRLLTAADEAPTRRVPHTGGINTSLETLPYKDRF